MTSKNDENISNIKEDKQDHYNNNDDITSYANNLTNNLNLNHTNANNLTNNLNILNTTIPKINKIISVPIKDKKNGLYPNNT